MDILHLNTNIDVQQRKAVVGILEKLLANEYLLFTKTLKFHWNVKGRQFGTLHAFFLKQYEQLLTITDDVAERIRALGFDSLGSMTEFLQYASLQEEPGVNPSDIGMLKQLLADHEHVICHIREVVDKVLELGDVGTNNFLSELIEQHEKIAWMIRAHLE